MTDATPDDYVSFHRLNLSSPPAPTIPTTAYRRCCERIEPEPTDGSLIRTNIEDRFAALAQDLPLAGGTAMGQHHDGTLSLTRHLRDEAPWLAEPIDLIDRQLRAALWAGRPWITFRPLLLVGPPGCGKSHLARLLAGRAGTGHAVLDLAGASDNRTLEGTARGWTTAQPCFAAVTINQARTANPILCIEEIDKAGGSRRNGDPLATILTMIERSTARSFFDKCLMAPVDLSHVNWIMTANDASRLPAPLRSRLDIVHVAGPEPKHFDQLLGNLVRDLARGWELPTMMLPDFEPDVVAYLRDRFTRHRSVRRAAADVEATIAALIQYQSRRPQ